MKKQNNKGFSLVELIIVIAIIAILTGTFTALFFRYIEKTRVTTDNDTIGKITSSIRVAITDTDVYENMGDPITIQLTNTKTTVSSGDTYLDQELNSIIPRDVALISKVYSGGVNLTITKTSDSGLTITSDLYYSSPNAPNDPNHIW